MTTARRGARPIRCQIIRDHYTSSPDLIDLYTYLSVWRSWLYQIQGLDQFSYGDYTQGTAQTFDHFVLRHAESRTVATLPGEFQYHGVMAAGHHAVLLPNELLSRRDVALIISVPFSDLGTVHPDLDQLLSHCDRSEIPVCLDLAYWGIYQGPAPDLGQYSCVESVTASLSKAFYTLEQHRVGVRFSRDYLNDGISMINEMHMYNHHSMCLGVHYMKQFSADWNWQYHGARYQDICIDLGLELTDTVIFGLGDSVHYPDHNRGLANNHRVCIAQDLSDIKENS